MFSTFTLVRLASGSAQGIFFVSGYLTFFAGFPLALGLCFARGAVLVDALLGGPSEGES